METKKINLGRVGLVPKGAYSPDVTYGRLHVVTYKNTTYWSKQEGNTGHEPNGEGEWWGILVDGQAAYAGAAEAKKATERANTAAEKAEQTNTAVDAAEQVRESAEEERKTAETQREEQAQSMAEAEQTRTDAEQRRAEAETQRVEAEKRRVSEETLRAAAEETRKSDEADRIAGETSREQQEESRVAAEQTRDAQETQRKIDETKRTDAETKRADAENTRKEAEVNRANAETDRAAAETARVKAETARADAETKRAAAETKRESDFSAKVTEVDTAVANAKTATSGAEKVDATITEANVLEVTGRDGVKKTLGLVGQAEASEMKAKVSELSIEMDAVSHNLYNKQEDITGSYINKINANRVFVSSLANVGEKYNTELKVIEGSTYYLAYLYKVIEGVSYEINVQRNNLAKAFAVLDENMIVLETESEDTFSGMTDKLALFHEVITIPKGGKYLAVHTKNSAGFVGKVSTLDGDIVESKKNIAGLTEELHSRFGYYKKNGAVISTKNIRKDTAWDIDKAITFDGEIIDDTTYKACVTHDYVRVVPLKLYKFIGATSLFATCAFYDKNKNYIGVNTEREVLNDASGNYLNFKVPKDAYYAKFCAKGEIPASLIYTDEDYLVDLADNCVYSYFDNSETRLRSKNVQDAICELVSERDNYIPSDKMNLCNAGMYCNLVHTTVNSPDSFTTDPLIPFTLDAPSLYRNNGTCGLKVKGLAGVGRKSLTRNFNCHVPQSTKCILGFWIKIEDFLESDFKMTTGSGWHISWTYSDLMKDGSKPSHATPLIDAKVVYSNYVGYSYIQAKILGDVGRMSIKAPYIHNFSSFVVNDEIDGKDINPWISYKILPEIFNSNCIGKILCYTGDSNGGGGVGYYKRLSWAARYLGMPMIGASNGGWSMQARMLNSESNSYGWLYYHKHRNKIINTNADIYYFNQCTNDGNGGKDAVFNEDRNLWETTDVDNFGITYNQTGAVSIYGRYGNGTFDEVKKVLDTYTDEFAGLLEKGDLNAMYKGEPLIKYCRRDFSTLACTGAFIAEIQQKQPDAMCIIDSTISSIGVVNTLIGAFSASGIVSSSHYEEDGNGHLVYSPYLLSKADSDGYVMDYIANGTINGGNAVTDITAESDLNDGKNYSLYHYYMFKQFGINPSSSTPSQEQIDEVCRLCHTFYEERMGTSYGRCTPLNIVKMRPDLIKGSALNQKAYRDGVRNIQSFFRVPFIDAGWGTCISPFNVGLIAADAGHWKKNGMQKLGVIIANSMNQLFLSDIRSDF